jgi:hypothetical protein
MKQFLISLLNKKVFCFFLLLFSLILIILAIYGEDDNYFIGNIVPELIGVCVEFLILLLIFEFWQKKDKQNQLITLEKRLREYLIFFLKHNFQSLPYDIRIGKFFGKEHHTNIQDLSHLIKHLQSHELSGNNIFSIKSHCLLEASTLGNLLPVASQLTDEHFKAWCRIVYFANKISISDNPSDIQKYTIDILQNMKRFDTASFANKLYVGA